MGLETLDFGFAASSRSICRKPYYKHLLELFLHLHHLLQLPNFSSPHKYKVDNSEHNGNASDDTDNDHNPHPHGSVRAEIQYLPTIVSRTQERLET